MTTERPIKCSSPSYKADPFYFVEDEDGDKRFVVSIQDINNIQLLLTNFIAASDNDLEIKIRDHSENENPLDFWGLTTNKKLVELLELYHDFLFHDGYHVLMIRNPKTNDYIVFDEHGLVFIYTNKDYSEILNKMGLPYKPNAALIYEFDHWHYRAATGEKDLQKIINELKLQQEI